MTRDFATLDEVEAFLDWLARQGLHGGVIIEDQGWRVCWDEPCGEPAASPLASGQWFPDSY